MIHQDRYDTLNAWQRAIVNKEGLSRCRDDPAYLAMDIIAQGDWQNPVCLHADGELYRMRDEMMDDVLEDQDFMEAITTEAEDRFMTRGNNCAR